MILLSGTLSIDQLSIIHPEPRDFAPVTKLLPPVESLRELSVQNHTQQDYEVINRIVADNAETLQVLLLDFAASEPSTSHFLLASWLRLISPQAMT